MSAAALNLAATTNLNMSGCACKNSRCLKRYCVCFERGETCDDNCRCLSCANVAGNTDLIAARGLVPLTRRSGCRCTRSKCLKRYCECFAARIKCNLSICKCIDCGNVGPGARHAAFSREDAAQLALRAAAPAGVPAAAWSPPVAAPAASGADARASAGEAQGAPWLPKPPKRAASWPPPPAAAPGSKRQRGAFSSPSESGASGDEFSDHVVSVTVEELQHAAAAAAASALADIDDDDDYRGRDADCAAPPRARSPAFGAPAAGDASAMSSTPRSSSEIDRSPRSVHEVMLLNAAAAASDSFDGYDDDDGDSLASSQSSGGRARESAAWSHDAATQTLVAHSTPPIRGGSRSDHATVTLERVALLAPKKAAMAREVLSFCERGPLGMLLEVAANGHLVCIAVKAASPAHRLGVQVGSAVIAVNEEAPTLVNCLSHHRPLVLELLRPNATSAMV
ncbi:hypothetical protein M885DRAFT_618088 [Pelagophyceae sp. CCMP2097]|nr:hypothetical protein M885DRAFT_618088 [Pelagophyceae sp. CCMP2097]